MIVVPAIDLLEGRAVRLREGRRDEATVYHERPWEMAGTFVAAGASCVPVVDLDGAFAGAPRQTETIGRIARIAGVPVQAGGGLRDQAAVETVLAAGASLAVLGTAALLLRLSCVPCDGSVLLFRASI